MPRAKASNKAAAEQSAPKRRGRPPKAQAAATAKAEVAESEAAVDGRRVTASPATNRAVDAATRALDRVKSERAALAAARNDAEAARNKANETGAKADKTAAKKAQLKVQRTSVRVNKARTAAKAADVRVVKLKARDRLNARFNFIKHRLEQADALASEHIASKLERAVEKFRSSEAAKLQRLEARKAKARAKQAEQQRAKFQREHDKAVLAADNSLAE